MDTASQIIDPYADIIQVWELPAAKSIDGIQIGMEHRATQHVVICIANKPLLTLGSSASQTNTQENPDD
ncbi:MAG: hypothetical protein R3B84_14025 [Zavarzinella sp.]